MQHRRAAWPECWATGEEHTARIAVKSVFDDRNVNINGVTVLECLVSRNPVTHHVIHRCTDGFRETAIIERGGDSALYISDVFMTQTIELTRRNTGFYIISYHIKDIGCEPAGDSHFVLLFGCFNRY